MSHRFLLAVAAMAFAVLSVQSAHLDLTSPYSPGETKATIERQLDHLPDGANTSILESLTVIFLTGHTLTTTIKAPKSSVATFTSMADNPWITSTELLPSSESTTTEFETSFTVTYVPIPDLTTTTLFRTSTREKMVMVTVTPTTTVTIQPSSVDPNATNSIDSETSNTTDPASTPTSSASEPWTNWVYSTTKPTQIYSEKARESSDVASSSSEVLSKTPSKTPIETPREAPTDTSTEAPNETSSEIYQPTEDASHQANSVQTFTFKLPLVIAIAVGGTIAIALF